MGQSARDFWILDCDLADGPGLCWPDTLDPRPFSHIRHDEWD